MIDKVFSITGNKVSSLLIDENSLKFSSQEFASVLAFNDAWNKKLSLATKAEVKYDSIKSIKKEDNDKDILIKYKTWAGIPGNCQFSFQNGDDYETFFNFLEEEKYFNRTQEKLSPINAIKNYIIGLVATIGFTVFCYFQAVAIANGAIVKSSSGRVKTFNYLISFLGDKGVIAVGVCIAGFLLYKVWTRVTNPPNQMKFLPRNT